MLKVGRRLNLIQEPLGTDHRCEFALEDLERNPALVLEIVG
jgi:hypothetical protein